MKDAGDKTAGSTPTDVFDNPWAHVRGTKPLHTFAQASCIPVFTSVGAKALSHSSSPHSTKEEEEEEEGNAGKGKRQWGYSFVLTASCLQQHVELAEFFLRILPYFPRNTDGSITHEALVYSEWRYVVYIRFLHSVGLAPCDRPPPW